MNSNTSNIIYHEKQIRELCALHALNNLFQSRDAFTKSELDLICYSLSPDHWINPHKSILGLGNYDINVIMKALQSRGCEAIWFDKRKKHWVTIRDIAGLFYNLDSKLDNPLLIGRFQDNDLLNYLRDELDCIEKQLFLVVTEEAAKDHTWLCDGNNYMNTTGIINSRDSDIVPLSDINNDQFINFPVENSYQYQS
ncbi:josephin-like protein isoform X3 [Leptinotarsa decemlineata]|uniref:josephin-like protein isoform X3 n=1 Tax=Leptinotarsa decemlineata TaxID=7539 RepID=UPI000C2519D1|nr:josephin-like protein isoform X2 [Leptinotarsa decemlineata]